MYDAAALGGNSDQLIDRRAAVWAHLRIWVDRNHDAQSQRRKLSTSRSNQMAIADFDEWREELLFTGRIISDSDTSVMPEEAERRCHRYIELVEAARGIRSRRVLQALVDSLQVDDDYEVYERTVGLILDVPARDFGAWLIDAFPGLIERQPDRAGDLLSLMINSDRGGGAAHLSSFRLALEAAAPAIQREIRTFIKAQESSGWLEDKPGYFDAGS